MIKNKMTYKKWQGCLDLYNEASKESISPSDVLFKYTIKILRVQAKEIFEEFEKNNDTLSKRLYNSEKYKKFKKKWRNNENINI